MNGATCMSSDDKVRAARLCQMMNDYILNRPAAVKDRQVQEWIAQAMTQEQRCKALVSLMNFTIACKQRQAEAPREQSVH